MPIGGAGEGSGLPVPLLPLRTTAAGADGDRRFYYVIGNAAPDQSIENPPMPTPDCVLPDAGSAGVNGQVLMDQLPMLEASQQRTTAAVISGCTCCDRPTRSTRLATRRRRQRPIRLSGRRRHGHDRSQGGDQVTQGTNPLYSVQRLQPMRGGQLIPSSPVLQHTRRPMPMDSRSSSRLRGGGLGSVGRYGDQDITQPITHTLGRPNRPAETDWDYIPFLDRDFTSLAELLLVPRCAPGLFTKKFVEQAPPIPLPPPGAPFVTPPSVRPAPLRIVPDAIPQTYPYLADEFFYTGAPESAPPHWDPAAARNATYVGGPSGAGWYKMLEFFEVPSRSKGATGRVSQGMNFDAARSGSQARPREPESHHRRGGVPERHGATAAEFPAGVPAGGLPTASGHNGEFRRHARGDLSRRKPGLLRRRPALGGAMDSHLKAAFVEFLRVRHGGSGYLFAFGSGAVGTPNRAVDLPNNLQVAAERPFRSLSFPDINATVLRPAALPPSPFSSPPATAVPLPASQPYPLCGTQA